MTTYTEPTYPSSNRRHATEQNTRIERDPERTNSRSRSRRPHRGITIRWGGPASCRPRDRTRAVDLDATRDKIIPRWQGC